MPHLDLRRRARLAWQALAFILAPVLVPAALADPVTVKLGEQTLSVQVGSADHDLWRGKVWIGGSYYIEGGTLFLGFTSRSVDEQATCDVGANIPHCDLGAGSVIDMRTWRRENDAAGIMIGRVRVVFDQGEAVTADSWSQGSRYQMPAGATRVERVEIAIKPSTAVVQPTSLTLVPEGSAAAAVPQETPGPGSDATAGGTAGIPGWLAPVAVAAGLGVLFYGLSRRRKKTAPPDYVIDELAFEDGRARREKTRLASERERFEGQIPVLHDARLQAARRFLAARDASYRVGQRLDEIRNRTFAMDRNAVAAAGAQLDTLEAEHRSLVAQAEQGSASYQQAVQAEDDNKAKLVEVLERQTASFGKSAVSTIVVRAGGEVFRAEFDGSKARLLAMLDRVIAEQAKAVANLDKTRRRTRDAWRSANEEACRAFDRLSRAVLGAIAANTAIDVVMFAKEVFEGYKEAGVVGAVGQALWEEAKMVFELVKGDGDDDPEVKAATDEFRRYVEAAVERPPVPESTKSIAYSLAASRLDDELKAVALPVIPHGCQFLSGYGLDVLEGAKRGLFGEETLTRAIKGVSTQTRAGAVLEKVGVKLDTATRAAERLLDNPSRLKIVGTALFKHLGEQALNLIADFSAIKAKEHIKYQVIAAHFEFIEFEANACILFPAYGAANDAYHVAKQELENLVEAKRILLQQDMSTQFRITLSSPWRPAIGMTIEIMPEPQGDFGLARVGGIQGLPTGPGRYSVEVTDAVEFRPGAPRRVRLDVTV